MQNPKEDLISTIPPVEPKGGEDILQQQFPNIQEFQYTGYAPVLKDKKWEYKLQMKSKKYPAAQIHHTGHSHWITRRRKHEDTGQL